MNPIGKMLMTAGVLMLVAGVLITVGSRFGLGKLPGDFFFQKGNTSFYFPLTTSLMISLLLTILLNLFLRR